METATRRSAEPFAEEARTWGVSPGTALALFVLPFSGLILFIVDLFRSGVSTRFLQEDSIVEWVTAGAIVTTAVLAVMVARTLWHVGLRVHGLAYALLAVAAIIAAAEEISWGERLLGIDAPESVREANQQGELNLHNLDAVYGVYVAGMLFIGLYGSVGSWFVYRFKRWENPDWRLIMPPFFLAGAFAQLAAYRLFRYTGIDGRRYGEWCELCVAVAIGIFVALNFRRLRQEKPPPRST